MNKSHTTLIYAIRKLETQLGIHVLKVEGRRAVLSNDGKSLLRIAKTMIEQAKILEDVSSQLSQGIESNLVIGIDHLCDKSWLYKPMAEFLAVNKTTSVQVVETSLSKTTNMVVNEESDISIITLPVMNHPSEVFAMVKMLPVVARNHPLAAIIKPCMADITNNSQIVLRDLGNSDKQDVGLLKSSQRITVDNFDHAWQAVKHGLGYCRLPSHIIEGYNDNDVVVLDLEHASAYQVPLHITLPKGRKSGPSARYFYQLLLASANLRQENAATSSLVK